MGNSCKKKRNSKAVKHEESVEKSLQTKNEKASKIFTSKEETQSERPSLPLPETEVQNVHPTAAHTRLKNTRKNNLNVRKAQAGLKDRVPLKSNASVPVQPVVPNIKKVQGVPISNVPVQSVTPNIKDIKNIRLSKDKQDRDETQVKQFPMTKFSPGFRTNRMILRICPKYIGVNGCNANYCYRFHVCCYWVRRNCTREKCSYAHDFQSKHNQDIFQFLQTESFGEDELKMQLKRNFYKDKDLCEDLSPIICMNNILGQCKKKCEDYHVRSIFLWQMYLNEKWTKFGTASIKMEKSFCDPYNSEFNLDLHDLNQSSDSLRLDLVFPGQSVNINFNLMQLRTSDNLFCSIRRLSTVSDVTEFKSVATRWLWYWKDERGTWKYYNNAFVNKFAIVAFSDYIETQYHKKNEEFVFKFDPRGDNFKIIFGNMTQVNTSTSFISSINRRPVPIYQRK